MCFFRCDLAEQKTKKTTKNNNFQKQACPVEREVLATGDLSVWPWLQQNSESHFFRTPRAVLPNAKIGLGWNLRTNRGFSLESFPDFLAFPLSIERGPPFPSWCRPQKMDLSPYITPRPVPRPFTLHKTNILWDVFVFLCLCLDYNFSHVDITTLHPINPTQMQYLPF